MDALPPPPVPAAHCAATPFAQGLAGEWTLTDCGQHLILNVAGGVPIRITSAGWHSTPAGRILAGTDLAGHAFTLRVEQAICAPGKAQRVVLTMRGQSWTGCLLAHGDRPYGQ